MRKYNKLPQEIEQFNKKNYENMINGIGEIKYIPYYCKDKVLFDGLNKKTNEFILHLNSDKTIYLKNIEEFWLYNKEMVNRAYYYIFDQQDFENTTFFIFERISSKEIGNENIEIGNILVYKNNKYKYKFQNVTKYASIYEKYYFIYGCVNNRNLIDYHALDLRNNNVKYIGESYEKNIWRAIDSDRNKMINERTKKLKRKIIKHKILKNNRYCFSFFSNYSKNKLILERFIRNADYVEEIKNPILDEDVRNYYVEYSIKRLYDLGFILYCNDTLGNGLGNDEYDKFLPELINDYPFVYIQLVLSDSKKYFKLELEELYKKCDEEIDYKRFPKKINFFEVDAFSQREVLRELLKNYFSNENNPTQFRRLLKKYKEQKEKIFNELLEENPELLNIKWKNEFDLYRLVKSYYNDAIYQYRSEWLELQSLDIFIPSINVGIEYQGIQHYQEIEFFGGTEAFIHRQKLDNLKKEKCNKNNVKIIEWKYDEPLLKNVLIKKIKNAIKKDV